MMPPPEAFRAVRTSDLPIFRQDHDNYALFYAPGYLAVVEIDQANLFEAKLTPSAPAKWPAVTELRRYAIKAQQTWADARSRPFAPVCMTLYLNNECNLGCTYCYANPSPRPARRTRGRARGFP